MREDLPQHLLEHEEDNLEVDRLGRVLLEELFFLSIIIKYYSFHSNPII